MDFKLDEEQQMLADTVQRFVNQAYAFDDWRKLAASARGFSEQHWQTLAAMGLTGLNVPENHGGLGAGPLETMIVMEQLGRGLVLEPFLSTAVVGAALVARGATPTIQADLLPGIAAGTQRVALAALEPQGRFDLCDIETTAVRAGAGYRLDGRKSAVLHGDSAHHLIVAARTAGASTDAAGISLFVVDARAPGVTIKGFPNADRQRSANVGFAGVLVDADRLVGTHDAGYDLLEWGVDRGIAALCSEAVGTMSRLHEITMEYLRTRKQFGQPIGRFQALQHRAAEMLVGLEHARSVTLLATAQVDATDRQARRRALSAAKAVVGRHARFMGQQAIQLHGGIGMTDELATGHYFKRLHCMEMTWGDTQHHTELFSALR